MSEFIWRLARVKSVSEHRYMIMAMYADFQRQVERPRLDLRHRIHIFYRRQPNHLHVWALP